MPWKDITTGWYNYYPIHPRREGTMDLNRSAAHVYLRGQQTVTTADSVDQTGKQLLQSRIYHSCRDDVDVAVDVDEGADVIADVDVGVEGIVDVHVDVGVNLDVVVDLGLEIDVGLVASAEVGVDVDVVQIKVSMYVQMQMQMKMQVYM